MTRRVPIRLVRLLAVVCACLLPAVAAHAAPPENDTPTTAAAVPPLGWTSLSVSQDIVVQASDWGDATTGPEDADPLPSCTGAVGFRSMWYALSVPEAAVLRVTVVSTDTSRYQPVVTVLDGERNEIACGVAALGKPGATATATAYVTPAPGSGTPGIYLVRVAQVLNNSPSGGLPTLTVRFAGRDVTPPRIDVLQDPGGAVQPGAPTTYDASGSADLGSSIDTASPVWQFYDRIGNHDVVNTISGKLRVAYKWNASGSRKVVFAVKDRAGNESTYRFRTFVLDTVPPSVAFSLRPPAPGAHRLRIVVKASESVRLSLLVTEAGLTRPLLRRTVAFWGDASHSRSIPLNGGVGSSVMVISGIARDRAGNATPLPQCVVNPVTGQGSCISP
jgi:hypothetical protein